MTHLRIAAAQSVSIPGDVAANVANHCRFIAAASTADVDILVFPELSLSGYELQLLPACTVAPHDTVLSPIKELARSAGMTAIVGAPVAGDIERPRIGSIIFFPDGRTSVYCKQYLHSEEELFAIAGVADARCYRLGGEAFAVAICADTSHEEHAQAASTAGASLYLASVLVSEGGYAADSGNLQRYAVQYGFATLMANHGGPSGGYVSAGKSALWSREGKLVIAAPGAGSYLVIASGNAKGWSGELLAV
jgi:predicted amidohydrolase